MLEKQTSQNTRVGLTRLFSKNFIRGHVPPDMNRTLSTQRYCFAADDSVYPHTAQLSLLKIFNTWLQSPDPQSSPHQERCSALTRLLQKLGGRYDRKPPERSNVFKCKDCNLKPHFDLKWPSNPVGTLQYSPKSHVPSLIRVIFCILQKYPVNLLSNRRLSRTTVFMKPLKWTSVCSCVTKCSSPFQILQREMSNSTM